MIKVLLADDQELIRQSLSFVMSRQEDIEMVGTAANGREALELVEEKQPDVVLLDIRMPEMDGVECTRRIKQEFPGIKVSYQNVPPSMSIRSCICCKPKPGVTLLQPMPLSLTDTSSTPSSIWHRTWTRVAWPWRMALVMPSCTVR